MIVPEKYRSSEGNIAAEVQCIGRISLGLESDNALGDDDRRTLRKGLSYDRLDFRIYTTLILANFLKDVNFKFCYSRSYIENKEVEIDFIYEVDLVRRISVHTKVFTKISEENGVEYFSIYLIVDQKWNENGTLNKGTEKETIIAFVMRSLASHCRAFVQMHNETNNNHEARVVLTRLILGRFKQAIARSDKSGNYYATAFVLKSIIPCTADFEKALIKAGLRKPINEEIERMEQHRKKEYSMYSSKGGKLRAIFIKS